MPVHLHVHSWYSLLEATAGPEALLQQTAKAGYKALALTDTNNLYGAIKFADLAARYGVRPLIGACLHHQRQRSVALAADRAGYRSLCRIISRLHLQARARTTLVDLLTDQSDGLHVLVDDAGMATHLREALGDRLWLEIVRPGRSPRQEKELLACGRRLGIRPVATSAVHLAVPEEYPAFRLVTALRRGILIDQLPGRLPITPAHALVDPNELVRRFQDLPEAVRNTDLLAEQLSNELLPRERVLPPSRIPRSLDATGYLRALCERGLEIRGMADDSTARQRLRQELGIIEAADFASYFLIVRDIARYAQRQGYSMALRGSAGNSLVCFLLQITEVDPLRFGLPMERFLHPGRADLPDIDLDFDWKVRDDVIGHVFQRYGADHTAMVSSHLCLQPRSAFREAGKVHGLSNDQISRLLETLPARVGGIIDPEEGKETEMEALPPRFPLEPQRWPRIVADARLLRDRPHHLSIHPGGVIITPDPIENYVPLQRAPKGVIIAQFEKDAVEAAGLVKIDLLGNRALSTVDEALRLALGKAGRHFQAPAECPATLDLLRQSDTLGVNQVESPAMRHLLRQIAPRGIADVIQGLALVRPGAASLHEKRCFIHRRRGEEPVSYLHPSLEPVLGETYGVMIYEDDALRVIQALTGWPASEADWFRKRLTKPHGDAEDELLAKAFAEGCARQGISEAVARAQWEQLAKFHYYAFCKSHAVSYGLIAWKATYLKVHHRLCFWTAALNNNQGVYPRRVYIEAIKRDGISLKLPCINRSAGPFTPEDGAIRVGLEAIGGLDQELRETVLADRERRGLYRDLADFRRRLKPGPEALAILIRTGALDFTGKPRPALFLGAELEDALHRPVERQQPELFPADGDWGWNPADYAAERRMQDEWDGLGFIVGPPLMSLFRPRLPVGLVASRDLEAYRGRTVQVAGMVAASRDTTMIDGRLMQFVTLEDEWGLIEVTLFPGECPPVPYLCLGPYLARGMVEEQYGVMTITAQSFHKAMPQVVS
jgi:DNA-directed DNA polymerase III PolC